MNDNSHRSSVMDDSERRLMQKHRHEYRDALQEHYQRQSLPAVEWSTDCADDLIVKADVGDGIVLATRIGALPDNSRVSLMVYGQHREGVEYSTAHDETLDSLELPIQVSNWTQQRLSVWVEGINRAATALKIALQARLDQPRIEHFIEEGLLVDERTGAHQQIDHVENRLGLGNDYYDRPYDQHTRRSLQHGLETLHSLGERSDRSALHKHLAVKRNDDEVMNWLASDPHRHSYHSPRPDEPDSRIREANDNYSDDGLAEVKEAILDEQRDVLHALDRYIDRHGPQLQSIIEHHK